jgi:hypothetical protein
MALFTPCSKATVDTASRGTHPQKTRLLRCVPVNTASIQLLLSSERRGAPDKGNIAASEACSARVNDLGTLSGCLVTKSGESLKRCRTRDHYLGKEKQTYVSF